MLRLSEVKLPLDHAEADLELAIRARLKDLRVPSDGLVRYTVFRRAHDARKRSDIKLTYIIDVEVKDEASARQHLDAHPHCSVTPDMAYRFVAQAPANANLLRPVVIGMGPCGLFAGLILAQMGFRPIILERGKAVRERTKDTWGLWRKNVLNPESNVQFGEGGAGTFSDGKLYSQIKDPKHYGRKVLDEFVKAGAPEDILYLSRPHIGTFRLVSMVEKMRATIHQLGGEVRFEQRVEDIDIDVLDLSPERVGTFDLVLFLGVLYHVRDPVMILEKVASVTAGQLIIETVVDMIGISRPAAAFYPARELNDDPTNWWGPNEAAVRGMLHAVGFSRVECRTPMRSAPYRAARAAWHALNGKNRLASAYRQDRAVFHAFRR